MKEKNYKEAFILEGLGYLSDEALKRSQDDLHRYLEIKVTEDTQTLIKLAEEFKKEYPKMVVAIPFL